MILFVFNLLLAIVWVAVTGAPRLLSISSLVLSSRRSPSATVRESHRWRIVSRARETDSGTVAPVPARTRAKSAWAVAGDRHEPENGCEAPASSPLR